MYIKNSAYSEDKFFFKLKLAVLLSLHQKFKIYSGAILKPYLSRDFVQEREEVEIRIVDSGVSIPDDSV